MNLQNNNFQRAISTAYILLGSFFVCGGIGYYIFVKTNQKIWLIAGLIAGAIIGMYELFKLIQK